MTNDERIKTFMDAYNTLITQYGVGLKPVMQPEKLGEAILIKPALQPVLVDDWQPPKVEGDDE